MRSSVEVRDKVYAEIFMILQEQYEGKEISGEMSLFDDLKMDSIDIISLIVKIEEKYHLQFTEYDRLFESMENVDMFIQYFADIIVKDREQI